GAPGRGGEHRTVLQAGHVRRARRGNHPGVHDLLGLCGVHSHRLQRAYRAACSTISTPTSWLHASRSLLTTGPGLPSPSASPLTLTTGSRQYLIAVSSASAAC